MTQIEAIYENGVLRPLSPLPLEENQRVRVFVTAIFAQKTDAWDRVKKERLEEAGKKIGMLPNRAPTEEERASA